MTVIAHVRRCRARPQPRMTARESGTVVQIDRIARDEHFPFTVMRSIDWLFFFSTLEFCFFLVFFFCFVFFFLRFLEFPYFSHSFRWFFFIGLSEPSFPFFLFLYSIFRHSKNCHLPPPKAMRALAEHDRADFSSCFSLLVVLLFVLFLCLSASWRYSLVRRTRRIPISNSSRSLHHDPIHI